MLKIKLGVFIYSLLLAFTNVDVTSSDYSLASLFKIERSKDANQILYDVNIKQTGDFDAKNPINVYWIKNTKGGKIEPLTWIQKKYAYGLKYLNVNDDFATFQFVSYNKMFFTLRKKKDNQFEVYTKYNGNLLKMDRIFIQLDGGSFWVPNITAVKVYAKNVKTGEDVIEVIKP